MSIKAVIFDFFGVISTEVSPFWFAERFTDEEAKILKEKYEACLVKGKENMKRYLNLIKEEERKKASDKEVTDRLIGEIVTSYF